MPKPDAPEDWQKTEIGLYVPKSDLRTDEKKKAVPVADEGLTPEELRGHGMSISRIIRTSLSNDPIWETEDMGWQNALRNGAKPANKLGVLVSLLEYSLWDATYSDDSPE